MKRLFSTNALCKIAYTATLLLFFCFPVYGNVEIPCHLYNITSKGCGKLSDKRIEKGFEVLNDGFQDKLKFKLVKTTLLDRPDLFNKGPEELESFKKDFIQDTRECNILVYAPKYFAGYAKMPWMDGYKTVDVNHNCWVDGANKRLNAGKVLIHEMGHHFGLYHVFEQPSDLVGDTPDCYFDGASGTTRLRLNNLYESHNYMAYCPDDSRIRFTKGQFERMLAIKERFKLYLGE